MKRLLFLLPGLLFFSTPQIASAHAFGKMYTLPIPLWMYLYGSAGALIVSFLLMGFFMARTRSKSGIPSLNLTKSVIGRLSNSSIFILCLKLFGIFFFALTVTAGLVGSDSATDNFNMTFFWVIFVLGFTYLTFFLGNIWSVVNPWKSIIELVEFARKREVKGLVSYPAKLGYLPAVVLYMLFIISELFSHTTPFSLSVLLVQYTIVTFFAVCLFGKNAWFTYGEFFSVFYLFLSYTAPFVKQGKKLFLQPPFLRLVEEKSMHLSALLFVLFMLSSTAFDGFQETVLWFSLYWDFLSPYLEALFGLGAYQWFQIIGLVLSPFVFLLLFVISLICMKLLTKTKKSITELALDFTFTLIPIALVYHVAHYYTLLLMQGPDILRLVSDPFGRGWNLFGTVNFVSDMSWFDAGVVWHVQLVFILLGHITAGYLAHLVALKIFPTTRQAVLGQLPILILMVFYTVIGLWILSQPITAM